MSLGSFISLPGTCYFLLHVHPTMGGRCIVRGDRIFHWAVSALSNSHSLPSKRHFLLHEHPTMGGLNSTGDRIFPLWTVRGDQLRCDNST